MPFFFFTSTKNCSHETSQSSGSNLQFPILYFFFSVFPCPPLWLVCAPCRSYPGLFSLASSRIWRWWLGLCYTRQDMPPCSGAASPSRLVPLLVPSPCSPWSTCIKCLPELRSVWITAASGSEIMFLIILSFLQLPFTPHGKWLFKTCFGFLSKALDLSWPHCFVDEAFYKASSADSEVFELLKVKKKFPDNGCIVLLYISQEDVKCIWCSNTSPLCSIS